MSAPSQAGAPVVSHSRSSMEQARLGTSRPRVAFIVNGSENSAMAQRAQSFADRLLHAVEPVVIYRRGRKGVAAVRMLHQLKRLRPDFCYVFDLGLDGFLSALLYGKATGVRFAIDTGDDVVALGRALGRGRLGMFATRAMVHAALRASVAWIVRGTRHRDLLAAQGFAAEWIPDGVDVQRFAPPNTSRPAPPSSSNPLVIGMLGSVTWIPKRNFCYGSELIELVAILSQRLSVPVRGVVVGDGDGLPRLRRRARELGVEDKISFVGRVPYAALPSTLHGWHFALSTQSNDAVGNMRTTGKLPLYLAAGRFVLASEVGEAARILPKEMVCPYRGEHDAEYPQVLAQRVEELLRRGVDVTYRADSVLLAQTYFEYDRLSTRLERVLQTLLGRAFP